MGLRDWANRHPKAVAGLAGLGLLVCLGGIVAEVLDGRHAIRMTAPDHYYSTDDGKTFFAADGSNIAPFGYHGGTALRAYVFECEGKQFVGYLERYTPEARVQEMGPQAGSIALEANGREVKRPGDTAWISSKDRKAASKLERITCPGGSSDVPTPIEP